MLITYRSDEVLASELLDIENMEFSIVENSIHISPEENQNVNNRDINSYCVINVNNLGNSELNVNETPFVSTSLVEPFIDIKPTKSPTKIYSIDEEYSDPILVKDGGRKRQKVNRKLAAKLAKHQLQTDFIISCKHNDKSSLFCKVFEISLEDIKNFKFKLCSETSKIEQDKILISYMWIIKPKRTNRRTDLSKNDRLVVKYFIPLKNEKKPVCAKAFSDITGITRRRLNILSNSFRNFHTSPKEKRGGARVTLIDKATTVSITHHIQQFKAKKSHYSRKDSDRCYLQPNLSLSKMYNLWTIEMKRTDQPIASIGKYKTIFYKHFNLSFGHPRLDVCSHCTELKAEINAININAIQKDLLTNKLSLHKEQSKHFHRIMKLENKNTINIAFDMMQNQPIPKLSVTEVFYSRQVWVYNLTFVLTTEKQIPQNCHMYTWTETESGRGPNEVGSALIHFLKMLEDKFQNKEDAPTVVNLFSDSCSGQNKNQFIMAVLLHFINFESKIFSEINHFFPVRGHSYMPPDQVFGRIEQELRKIETIISPSEYHKIFKKHTTVNVYGKDFNVYDYKSAAKNIIKQNQFKTTEQKRFQYLKGKNTVGISKSYEGDLTRVGVIKRKKKLQDIGQVAILPKQNHVKLAKKEDVIKLNKFFKIPADAEEFYNGVFQNPNNNIIENEEEEVYEEDPY
ncbi:hypothetical protein QTP88_025002 [Uroleucon formosanum]